MQKFWTNLINLLLVILIYYDTEEKEINFIEIQPVSDRR